MIGGLQRNITLFGKLTLEIIIHIVASAMGEGVNAEDVMTTKVNAHQYSVRSVQATKKQKEKEEGDDLTNINNYEFGVIDTNLMID